MPCFSCISINCCTIESDNDDKQIGVFQKFFYTSVFITLSILSVIFRHNPPALLSRIPNIHECNNDDNCLGTQQVLRLSFVGCIFFCLLALLARLRVRVHIFASVIVLIGLLIGSQFVPNENISGYAEFARVGSGVFLLLQLVLIMDFIYSANDYLLNHDDLHWILFSASACMVGLFAAGSGFLYYYFAPHALCSMNIGFITSTLILAVLYTLASIAHPEINHAGLFTSCVVAIYCLTLTASALASEPDDHECKGFGHSKNDFSTVAGFIFTMLLILGSIIRSSTRSSAFDMSSSYSVDSSLTSVIPNTADDEDVDGTNFTFFFIVFGMASMYFAMCLTSWQVDSVPDNYEVDKGRFSMWVKMITAWTAAVLYAWTLAAPLVLTDRSF